MAMPLISVGIVAYNMGYRMSQESLADNELKYLLDPTSPTSNSLNYDGY